MTTSNMSKFEKFTTPSDAFMRVANALKQHQIFVEEHKFILESQSSFAYNAFSSYHYDQYVPIKHNVREILKVTLNTETAERCAAALNVYDIYLRNPAVSRLVDECMIMEALTK